MAKYSVGNRGEIRDDYRVTLPKTQKVVIESIDDIYAHAIALWDAGTSPQHDFDPRADARSRQKFINDRVEGKVGELVFATFLHNLGYEAEVDYDIYDSYSQTDYADLKSIEGDQPACPFDVKTTKKNNHWLAVRQSIYDQHDPTDPFILVQVRPESVHSPPFSAELVGWVYKYELTEYFRRGSRMHFPGNRSQKIGPELKTDNWAIPIKNIQKRTEAEWREFIDDHLVR